MVDLADGKKILWICSV